MVLEVTEWEGAELEFLHFTVFSLFSVWSEVILAPVIGTLA